ncbi:IclR family transcriptional regulator [Arthrobacter sp. NPDC089319]|uniref:IclR family transcriptional regulator n=1 Tax=Arthrobacter sp. NPDC089319 TaxID=3155915 RepID=UPI0034142745
MADPADHPSGVREVKSAARTIDILEVLAARGNAPVTIRELCSVLVAPRSSIYALLRTLVDAGWVRTDPSRTTYSIGIRALLAGTTYLDADPLLKVIRPQLGLLGKKVGGTVNFGRLDGGHIVYLATWEAPGQERTAARVGRRLPAHATALGQAALASLDPAALRSQLPAELTSLTGKTITSQAALVRELAAVRRRGYAVEREQNTVGIACVAVSVDCGPEGVDALSVSLPLSKLRSARERDIAAALRETAAVTEEIVGGLAGLLG